MSDSSPPPGASDPGGSRIRRFGSAIRQSLSGEAHDFTSGSLGTAIALLAIPMVLELSMESVFALVDIWFVSQLGEPAVAAVGLTEALMTTVYAVAIGLAMATTAMVARRIGEKDEVGASLAATQAIALGIGLAAVLGIVGAVFAEELLGGVMEAGPDAVAIGVGYTRVLFATNIVIFLIHLNNAIYRGAGDPALAVRSLWLANAVNIVLDPCFIFGWGPFPEMGVTGAAVATTIGRGIGVAYQFWGLRKGVGRLRLQGDTLRMDAGVLRRLVKLAVPSISQFLIATASWTALVRIVSEFGDAAVAGYSVAVRIVMFTFLPSWGLSNAAATLVGQNLGAEQPERAERAVWLTGIWNSAFLAVVSVAFIAMPGPLVGFFIDPEGAAAAEAQAVGEACLRTFAYGYVFFAWGMVMIQAFNGAGDTRTPNVINLFCYWLFQIPLAYVLAMQTGLGVEGVFWAVAISETLYAVVCVLVFRSGRWKGHAV